MLMSSGKTAGTRAARGTRVASSPPIIDWIFRIGVSSWRGGEGWVGGGAGDRAVQVRSPALSMAGATRMRPLQKSWSHRAVYTASCGEVGLEIGHGRAALSRAPHTPVPLTSPPMDSPATNMGGHRPPSECFAWTSWAYSMASWTWHHEQRGPGESAGGQDQCERGSYQLLPRGDVAPVLRLKRLALAVTNLIIRVDSDSLLRIQGEYCREEKKNRGAFYAMFAVYERYVVIIEKIARFLLIKADKYSARSLCHCAPRRQEMA